MSFVLSSLVTAFLSLMEHLGLGDTPDQQTSPPVDVSRQRKEKVETETHPETETRQDGVEKEKVGADLSPEGKSKSDYEEEFRQAAEAIATARSYAAVNATATSALEAMENLLIAAGQAAERPDYEEASTKLQAAVVQAGLVAAEREKMRNAALERQRKLNESFTGIAERIGKLTVVPGPVTSALQTARAAKDGAEQACVKKPEDWPKAATALDQLENAERDLGIACVDAAKTLASGFVLRFTAKKDAKPASVDAVKLRSGYLVAKKKFDGLIGAQDGIGALEASAAVDTALTQFEAKADPAGSERAEILRVAISDVKKLTDEELTDMSMSAKAALAFRLCANGAPTSGDALDQLCRVYAKSPPEKAFLDERRSQRTKIAEKVAKIADIDKLFDEDGDVIGSEWSKIIADKDKVRDLLKQISDAQLEVLGLPPVTVSTYSKAEDSTGIECGGCVWSDGPPTIELNAHKDAIGDPDEAFISILHETFHAQQDMLVKQLLAGELSESDPLYPQVLMFMVNKPGQGYLPPDVDQDKYEAQPLEVDAESQGTFAYSDLQLAIRAVKSSGN
ncbi:MAG TPA: hypothetical protein VMU82_07530 [Acetobacteraceae bacterium]|nr:hypothetical protein [Acetobacteraceae bacterium]